MSVSEGESTRSNSKRPVDLDIGLGLRAPHYPYILEQQPKISWFEAISENYMGISGGGRGRPFQILEKIRTNYPLVLHGVSMSIGSSDELNMDYLQRLRDLVLAIEPCWVSDHICWTGVQGENLHDLLPLPYTEEVLKHLTSRILRVQDFLGRRLVFENVSAYLSFQHSEMTEWEFVSALCERADCDTLLDVNNVYVSSVNQGFDPLRFIQSIPSHRIRQIHLAGHSQGAGGLIDTHDAPVADAVWELYRKAIEVHGAVPTLIEWDANIPDFAVLESEARRAQAIYEIDYAK